MSERVSKKKAERHQRIQEYAKFLAGAKNVIEAAAEEISDLGEYINHYGFCVAAGGAAGGGDDRLVEVFLGQRPYEATHTGPGSVEQTNRPIKMLVEEGACLQYQRMDSGRVICLLYPSHAERSRPSIEMILLDEIGDPSCLLSPKVQKGYLKWLAAYMARTSLDGAMTLSQRLRVFWLEYFKPHYRDKKLHRTRAWSAFSWLGGWFFTVGLSGFLLIKLFPTQDNVTPQLVKGEQQAHVDAESLESRIDSVRANLDRFRADWTAAKAPAPASTKQSPQKLSKHHGGHRRDR